VWFSTDLVTFRLLKGNLSVSVDFGLHQSLGAEPSEMSFNGQGGRVPKTEIGASSSSQGQKVRQFHLLSSKVIPKVVGVREIEKSRVVNAESWTEKTCFETYDAMQKCT